MTRPPLLSDALMPSTEAIPRRSALGASLGVTAAAALGARPASAAAKGKYDLMDPETNLKALLKLQGDLAEKDVISGFGGEAWAWIAGKGNTKVFKTYGIGASRLQAMGDGVYRFLHKEVLYYCEIGRAHV